MANNKQEKLPHLYGVVLCQDSTTTLWPLSTPAKPFEFAVLPGAQTTVLEQAILRLKPYVEKIIFAASSDNALRIKGYIESSGLLAASEYAILTETYRRGTALTLALVAAQLRANDQQATMLVVPLLLSLDIDERWRAVVHRAYRVAATDHFALIATERQPGRRGATQSLCAIIKPGEELSGIVGAQKVRAYIDSPTASARYRAYEQGALDYTGIFAVRASHALQALRQPVLLSYDENAQSIQRIAETARFFATLGAEHWATSEAKALIAALPDTSMEQAVFGAAEELVCVPTALNIVGFATLTALAGAGEADRAGNVVVGAAHTVDAQDNLIINNATVGDTSKPIIALGVSDLVIVETDDALLIATKPALNQLPQATRQLLT